MLYFDIFVDSFALGSFKNIRVDIISFEMYRTMTSFYTQTNLSLLQETSDLDHLSN